MWNANTFNNRYDPDLLKKFERINGEQYYVEMEKEITDVIDHSQSSGTTKLLPSHLGVFILSHSKRIMNNFIHSLDGYRKPNIYSDTNSIYISSELFHKLEQDGFVGDELGIGKKRLWKWRNYLWIISCSKNKVSSSFKQRLCDRREENI